MRSQSGYRSASQMSWFAVGILLTLFAVALFDPIALLSTTKAQQDNRQLNREQAKSNSGSERRIALVIGNGAYVNAAALKNPPNDARDMASALKELGFEVTSGINMNQRDMKRLIREFGKKLKGGGSGLF